MDRRQKILGGLDLPNLSGVEIGALAWPLVRKTDGQITYVDFTDAETLRKNHAAAGNVPLDQIVEVDAIWGTNTLQQAIGIDRKVDYVIASHVIEHVPDVITWLEELSSVLKDGGEIRLAIPDRRFTFDYLRRETTIADVVAAYMHRARIPSLHAVLDFVAHYVDVDKAAMWEGKIDTGSLKPATGVHEAMEVAKDALNGIYRDVHCWVFTPRSLAALFASLARSGLLALECTQFFDTAPGEYEFFVAVRPCASVEQAAASWEKICTQARVDVPGTPEAREKQLNAALESAERDRNALISRSLELEAKLELASSEMAALRAHAQAEAERLQQRITGLERSNSWRVTAPLRAFSSFFRPRDHSEA